MSRVIIAALTVSLAACSTAPTGQGGKPLTLADASCGDPEADAGARPRRSLRLRVRVPHR